MAEIMRNHLLSNEYSDEGLCLNTFSVSLFNFHQGDGLINNLLPYNLASRLSAAKSMNLSEARVSYWPDEQKQVCAQQIFVHISSKFSLYSRLDVRHLLR